MWLKNLKKYVNLIGEPNYKMKTYMRTFYNHA